MAAPAVSVAEALQSLELSRISSAVIAPGMLLLSIPAVGTVNNLDLSDASTAVIALLQPVAVPASYCLCSVDLQRC